MEGAMFKFWKEVRQATKGVKVNIHHEPSLNGPGTATEVSGWFGFILYTVGCYSAVLGACVLLFVV
jgi:hypothetical protein